MGDSNGYGDIVTVGIIVLVPVGDTDGVLACDEVVDAALFKVILVVQALVTLDVLEQVPPVPLPVGGQCQLRYTQQGCGIGVVIENVFGVHRWGLYIPDGDVG